jgi:hypothetical protein
MESPEQAVYKKTRDITELKDDIKLLNNYRFWTKENPPEVIHSDEIKEKQYKARKHWWQTIIIILDKFANESNVLSDKLAEEVNIFKDKYCTTEFTRHPTTEEEIKEADNLVNKILEELCENL